MTHSRLRLAALAVALFATGPALAQDAGTFTALVVLQSDYALLDYHDGAVVFGGPLEGVGTTIESSAGPWIVGASSRVSCVVSGRRGPDGDVALESPCAVTDMDGDRWFTLAARQGKGGSNTEGQSEMLGGEGKYAGITGLCTYAVAALPDRWQTTTITCDWIRE